MGFYRQYIAVIYDEQGRVWKIKPFKRSKKTFKVDNKRFNIKLKEASHFDRNNRNFGITDKRYYQYNINNPDPILMDKKKEPIMNPEDYNSMLETKVVKDVNNLDKEGIFDKLNFKTLLVIGAVILGAYLLITGQLTP